MPLIPADYANLVSIIITCFILGLGTYELWHWEQVFENKSAFSKNKMMFSLFVRLLGVMALIWFFSTGVI